MKKRLIVSLVGITVVAVTFFIISDANNKSNRNKPIESREIEEDDENEAQEMRFVEERLKYEYDMLKNPATGKIPARIFEQEIALAKTLPSKNDGTTAREQNLNSYNPAGPNNIGGRTRALAYDTRYNGSTNRVILSGSVSGGILRSADGGATWTRVSPDNDVHNVSVIAQDPRPGFQDTWYAGTGESIGNSASELGAPFYGFGVFKSVNNGLSWTKLTMTNITDIPGNVSPGTAMDQFDNPFDYVHDIEINPVNGNVYISGHRRLLRSTDGGTSFATVFGGTVGAIAAAGQFDVEITSTGKIILAVNGGMPETGLRGVWTSTTGNLGSFTRIAGGTVLNVDSVAGWRGNSYTTISAGTPTPKRILLALAPSNHNIVYVLYQNGLTNESPTLSPEGDLYKLDMTGGNNTWTNLSANMPNFGKNNPATDPYAVQSGYNMYIIVKPNDANFVVLGGTSLYRSTDGFASSANTGWIGGYHPSTTTTSLFLYPGSHPDMHNIAFNPSNSNEAIAADDGGIQITNDITAAGSGTVVWSMLPNFQTLQYYYVGMDPEPGQNNFVGGAQDNGTQFRDKTGLLSTPSPDSNNHRRILTGDGTAVGFSKIGAGGQQFVYAGFQLGNIRRVPATSSFANSVDIRPNTLQANPGSTGEYGEFVTNFRLNPDNTEDLYYVNFNKLYRTTNASTVTPSTWTELSGIGTTIDPDGSANGFNAIRGMAFSRGTYSTSHVLYLGTTNGKLFRVDDPRNVSTSYNPVNITPTGNTGNIQDIAVNPNNDDEVLVAVSSYGVTSIWWTTNGKSASPTWNNVEGNLSIPSARSCMIVVKKDAANNAVTEYYVGTSIGLYSTLTLTGTPTWVREGGTVLNYAVVQSLAYRPVDNYLLVGTHGNGMYYTFLGTPNFNAGNTPVNPVINNKEFITKVYPTYSSDIVNFETGNLFSVKKIDIQLFNMSGQELYRKQANYQDGQISISAFARGAYILSITSDDKKYRQLQKIVKQ